MRKYLKLTRHLQSLSSALISTQMRCEMKKVSKKIVTLDA